MSLGGGTFTTQNKTLPGSYFQFVSRATGAIAQNDRGVVGVCLDLNWGKDGEIITVTAEDVQKNSLSIFGYGYDADELVAIRELLCYGKTLYIYKGTTGVAAANTYATAKCKGTRGNDIKIVVAKNIEDATKYDVATYVGTNKVDEQTVATASQLKANDFVTFKADATLSVTAGTNLTGGTSVSATTTEYQAWLNALESYPDVNVIVYAGDAAAIQNLCKAWVKRMRDEVGIKVQLVAHGVAADDESVINVKNQADLCYWVAGVAAGLGAGKSATNMLYNGELEISANYTQKQLSACIEAGEFVLHRMGSEVRVLEDINSLVTTSDDKGEVFKDNQTIRIIDTIATSIANVFNSKYFGKIPNDDSGRASLWSDIVKVMKGLSDQNALEGFDASDVVVTQGATKKSVAVSCAVTVVNAMDKLYMTTTLS